MSWHESLYNLSRDSVVDDDVLRIAVLDFRSGVKTGGIGMSASCPLFPKSGGKADMVARLFRATLLPFAALQHHGSCWGRTDMSPTSRDGG